ncbi:MAG: TOTE conflict system archaeo-eukaryotic primase domain-containing protein [Planctomycetota bacterium]|jgi:hypothetical protein
MKSRTTFEKLAIYRSLFTGLQNVYGTYDHRTGRVRQAKEPVTDQVLLAHLKGKRPYGVYLLVKDRIRALAVDFDEDKLDPPLAFRAEAQRLGIFTYIELSKSKGYHVWMFFAKKGVLARKARLVAGYILTAIGQLNIEIFPKQDTLTENTSFGNFINAPLFGALVPKGRTVFMHPAKPSEAYPDQWELLGGVQRIEERILDDVIRNYDLDRKQQTNDLDQPAKPTNSMKSSPQAFGLPLCAQRMLADGVTSQQRVSCFRLAVNLRRAGIPSDLTGIMLRAWARKNRPQDGKRVITEAEIRNQVKDAYEKPYRSCGCEDPAVAPYCDKRCPLCARSTRKPSSQ